MYFALREPSAPAHDRTRHLGSIENDAGGVNQIVKGHIAVRNPDIVIPTSPIVRRIRVDILENGTARISVKKVAIEESISSWSP